MTWPVTWAVLEVDPYVYGPLPEAMPQFGCFSTSTADCGTPDITDWIADVLSVDIGSAARWIADPAKLVDHGDGTWRWLTSAGSADPYWKFASDQLPTIDTTYDYRRRDGRTITRPAMIFHGAQWGTLRGNDADPLPEFTVLLVARLRRPNNAHRAGIVESRRGGTDTEDSSDIYLRLRGRDEVKISVDTYARVHTLVNTRRPHIIGCANGEKNSRLVFVGNQRVIEAFDHPSIDAYDMSWYLGRLGGSEDDDTTAVMDVLEVNVWTFKLSPRQIRLAVHRLNGLYKVTG